MALVWKQLRDLSNGIDESHVEHAICFIEDEKGHRAEIDVALSDEIEQAAWGCNEDIEAARDCLHLRTLTNTAEDHRVTQRRVATVTRKAFADLRSEFACWREHETAWSSTVWKLGRATRIVQQLMENGQRECCSLSGAGLRDTEEISTSNCRRNGLHLDRCRDLVFVFNERCEQRGVKAECRESMLLR